MVYNDTSVSRAHTCIVYYFPKRRARGSTLKASFVALKTTISTRPPPVCQ